MIGVGKVYLFFLFHLLQTVITEVEHHHGEHAPADGKGLGDVGDEFYDLDFTQAA